MWHANTSLWCQGLLINTTILFRASTSPGLSSGDALHVRFWMPTMDWVISMRTKFIPLPSSRPSRSFTHVNISPGWPVTMQTRLSPTLNNVVVGRICRRGSAMESLIARFMEPTWGIHRTNDQLRGKCFHSMTTSWSGELGSSRSVSAYIHWTAGLTILRRFVQRHATIVKSPIVNCSLT